MIVIGVHEVGRGALAGPIYAAALILDPDIVYPEFLKDSKKLSKRKRETICNFIIENNIPVFLAEVSNARIDAINTYRANREAQREAISLALTWLFNNRKEEYVSNEIRVDIDGEDKLLQGEVPERHIIDGDATEPAIMMAACYAKVHRDNLMSEYAKRYPVYGWEKNSGYSVKSHMEALLTYGPSELHRKTYGPVTRAIGPITGLDEIL